MSIAAFGIAALITGITWIPNANVKAVQSTGPRQTTGTDARVLNGLTINHRKNKQSNQIN